MTKYLSAKMLFLGLLLCVSVSCKKDELINAETPAEVVTPAEPAAPTPAPTVPTSPSSDVPANATIYELGTGSGNLTIDGSTLKITNSALIKVKSGSYKTITIKNITGSAAKPVFIKNNGQVSVTGSMAIDNVTYLTVSGDFTSGITYGFKFENISFRAVTVNGKMNYLTLKAMSFTKVGDYVIAGERSNGNDLNYSGSADTRTEGFKVLNCLFDNAGAISFGGNLNKDTGEDNGLFKDVEIANNIFQNTSAGTLCSFTNVQDYNIHHNVVNNVNSSNNDHNGIFFMQGNGKFHDNKLTNYQGNSIRMWLYSRGSTPATNEIYNNVCYNTRKYGAFELQAFDRNMYPGKTTYANAKVYNNTAGKMNTSRDWEGQLLDLYNTGGSLEYYNNLGFDLYSTKSVGNMINNMSDTKISKDSNNKYVPSQQDAVMDLTNFVSKITGVGESGLTF